MKTDTELDEIKTYLIRAVADNTFSVKISTSLMEVMEEYASQGEKEDGWIIVDPDGKVQHETLTDDKDHCWYSFCQDKELIEWTTKDELIKDGYKCVRAERTYKLI